VEGDCRSNKKKTFKRGVRGHGRSTVPMWVPPKKKRGGGREGKRVQILRKVSLPEPVKKKHKRKKKPVRGFGKGGKGIDAAKYA